MTNGMIVSSSLQDYLETILVLSRQSDEVRITDIADKLDVAKSSVHQAISKLKKSGLVHQARYGSLVLTKDGVKVASKIKARHDVLVKFFREVLRVNKETSERDACLIEHSISTITFEKLVEFLKNYTEQEN